MLTSREATEAPRQGSRSPLSPTEVTESATVRLFLILSALLCSVNNVDLRLLYRLRLLSRSPHNAQHSTSYKIRAGVVVHWLYHVYNIIIYMTAATCTVRTCTYVIVHVIRLASALPTVYHSSSSHVLGN